MVKQQGKTIFLQDFYRCEIIHVCNLFDDRGEPLWHDTIRAKFGVDRNVFDWIKWLGVISLVTIQMRTLKCTCFRTYDEIYVKLKSETRYLRPGCIN
jgi:hypothetical protein